MNLTDDESQKKLDLKATWKLDNVFHISLLKGKSGVKNLVNLTFFPFEVNECDIRKISNISILQ